MPKYFSLNKRHRAVTGRDGSYATEVFRSFPGKRILSTIATNKQFISFETINGVYTKYYFNGGYSTMRLQAILSEAFVRFIKGMTHCSFDSNLDCPWNMSFSTSATYTYNLRFIPDNNVPTLTDMPQSLRFSNYCIRKIAENHFRLSGKNIDRMYQTSDSVEMDFRPNGICVVTYTFRNGHMQTFIAKWSATPSKYIRIDGKRLPTSFCIRQDKRHNNQLPVYFGCFNKNFRQVLKGNERQLLRSVSFHVFDQAGGRRNFRDVHLGSSPDSFMADPLSFGERLILNSQDHIYFNNYGELSAV